MNETTMKAKDVTVQDLTFREHANNVTVVESPSLIKIVATIYNRNERGKPEWKIGAGWIVYQNDLRGYEQSFNTPQDAKEWIIANFQRLMFEYLANPDA